ncbi:MAG: class I SAM-dependent methyltransferase [Actinomycetota bacterium]
MELGAHSTAAVARAYGDLAERYIELFGRIEAMQADSLAVIERHLGGRAGPVLDVGCGPGHLTAHLVSIGVDAVGLDPVSAFLAHARTGDPAVRLLQGSAERLPVTDGAFGGVLAWFSLIHLTPASLGTVLAELRRALVPGGCLVVGFFCGEIVEPFDHKVTTAYYWPVDELSARLRGAGFGEVERLRRPADPEQGVRASGVLVAEAG